mmetsp:Transcript_31443/g.39052  ORF Transcript_31443/g.39052 Transcript_31443/m.39052 type:complete len:225 (-) Transcript_31443:210-884(-)
MFCATPRVFLIAALASWAIVPIRPRRPNGFLAPPNRSPRKPPPCFSFFCLPPSPLESLLPPSFGARVLPKTGPLRPSIPWLPQMPLPWLPPLPPFWPLPPCWFCWEGRKLCWLLARFYCCMLSSCRRFCSRSSLSSSRCLSRLSLSSSFCCYRRSFASWRLSCRSCLRLSFLAPLPPSSPPPSSIPNIPPPPPSLLPPLLRLRLRLRDRDREPERERLWPPSCI